VQRATSSQEGRADRVRDRRRAQRRMKTSI
jgi:hypothetical protein